MEKTVPFDQFKLAQPLLDSLNKIGFEFASPIQELTMAPTLEGKDIFAQAETGSGKTGAFAIPIIEQILREGTDKCPDQIHYVVLCPTRELAQQTHKVFDQIGKELGIETTHLIGGERIDKQKQLLKSQLHVLVATPGRLCDLIKQKAVSIKNCRAVVFDEADRLFDMGFQKDIEFILRKVPEDRQLIMLSATSNLDVLRTAYKFNSKPLELKLNEDSLLVDHIDHKLAMLSSHEKMPLLLKLLRDHEDAYALVFCNTQHQTHLVAEWLIKMNLKAKAISGRLPQNKRTKLMEDFRAKNVTILVCTDVAARGLDIKDVNFVINFDLPQEAANYVHRIGRTGRAGKSGQAISFCAHEDCEHLESIYELIESKIPRLDLNDDSFAKDLCDKPRIDGRTLKLVDKDSKKPRKDRERKDRGEELRPQKFAEKKERQEKRSDQKTEKHERKDKRERKEKFFTIKSYDTSVSDKKALEFFKITDKAMLHREEVSKGKRKFILFGPRLTEYKYKVSSPYRNILMPFLINLIKKAKLRLFIKVFHQQNQIKLQYSGDDERMLVRNENQLLYALEHLALNHLYRQIKVPEGLRMTSSCQILRKQERDLLSLVDKLKKKVLASKKPVMLKPLSSSERRLVHEHFRNDKKVKTTSQGDGKFKKIELALK